MGRYWGYHMVTAQTKDEMRTLLDNIFFPSLSESRNPDPELTEQEIIDLLEVDHAEILKRFDLSPDDDDTSVNMLTMNQVRQYAITEGHACLLQFFQPGVLMWKTFEERDRPVGMDVAFKFRQLRHMSFATHRMLHM